MLSPYFAKSHEDRAAFGKDEEFEGDERSPDVGIMRGKMCRKSRLRLSCDWLAGVVLSFSGFLFFTLQRPSGVCAKGLSGCRHLWQYPLQSAICSNSVRGSSKIGKEVPFFSLSLVVIAASLT